MKQTVAFIGLGAMGYPMAARIAAAGQSLRVFDIAPGAAARFAEEHAAQACASAADAAREAEFLITMLPSSNEVEDTLLRAGTGAAMRRGTTVIDMSSSEPMRTRALADTLARSGVALVDAPVSGGVKKARDGSLAIMFGGSEAQLAQCTPVLSTMGAKIFRTAEVGSGHAMKALNNFVSAAGLVAAVEALHIGAKFGLDPAVMTKILNASTGKNNSTENKFPQFVLSRAFNSGFGLGLMVKDLRTALDVAHATGTPAPLGEACVEAWARAEQLLGGQADHTAVVKYWERLAGSEIKGG